MADPSRALNPQDPLIGKLLSGRFLVKSLIDRGGMGKVYCAEQQPLGRLVALKTLDLLDPHGEFQQRFFNEAATAGRLSHPHTVRIFDYGRSEEGIYYLTMELLEGRNLNDLIKKEAPLDPERVIRIMRQVCGALQEAHDLGIVHRDMKPGNIFLISYGDDDEFTKVLDFGLVKDLGSDVELSRTGQALGSPLYMSPEQVEGDPVDVTTDIYSIGLVMYVALTGKVPFKRGSVASIMMQQVSRTLPVFAEIAPEVEIPASLEWIVRRCIEKKPADRFATMRELSNALKLCSKEMNGDLEEVIPWSLDAAGCLDLPPGLLAQADLQRSGRRLRPLPNPELLDSPTLSRTDAGVAAAGVALAGSGMVVLIGIVVVVLVLFAVLFRALISEPVLPQRSAPVPQVVPAPVPVPVPIVLAEKTVRLNTNPIGADVLKNGELMGSTPLSIQVGEEPLSLSVRLDGYRPREVRVDGSVLELTIPLKAKVRVKRRASPRPTPTPKPAPAPKPHSDVRDPWED